MAVLILTEKPKQAKAIGKLVDKVQRQQRGFSGVFGNKEVVVFPLTGSIMEVDTDFFDQFGRSDLSPLPFVPPEKGFLDRAVSNISSIPEKQEKIKEKNPNWDSGISICKSFSNMMNDFSYEFIILATDPDYEGASLGVEFLEYHGLSDKNGAVIIAMDISNLSSASLKKEIEKAMDKKDAYDWRTFSFIGSARADENACIGINETRLLRGHTGTFITFGTQQTRLLQKIVERTLENDNFKQVKKYRLKVQTEFGEFVLQLPEGDEDKITDKAFMSNIASVIKSNNVLTVQSVFQKKGIKRSPEWVDGSTMANMVSRKLVPKSTVTKLMGDREGLLQVMYEKEIMTYPRGECLGVMPLSQFKEQQDIAKMLSKYFDAPRLDTSINKKYLWRDDDKSIMVDGKPVMVNHTPYTIASDTIDPDTLTKDERVVFDEAAKIILSAFYPENKQIKTTIFAEVSDYLFKYVLTHDVDVGWKKLYDITPIETKLDSMYDRGDSIIIRSVELEEYKDKPNPLYTENSLLLLMKKYHIGAESTFTTHINNILDIGKMKRGFTTVEKTRIRATERGIALIQLLPSKAIEGLKEFDEKIISPLLEKRMEKEVAFGRRNDIIRVVHKLVESALLEGVNNPNSEKGVLIKKIKEGGTNGKGFVKPTETGIACPLCGNKVLLGGSGNYSCIERKLKKINDKEYKNKGTCDFFFFGNFNSDYVSASIPEKFVLDLYNGEKIIIEGEYKSKEGKKYKGELGLIQEFDNDGKRKGWYKADYIAWKK